jgi:glucokinase
MRYTIGVDLGGTNLRAGLVDTHGTIHYDTKVDTIVQELEAIFGRMVALIQTVQRQLPADGTLAGVGIGVPGPLDPVAGFVFAMPNIQGFETLPYALCWPKPRGSISNWAMTPMLLPSANGFLVLGKAHVTWSISPSALASAVGSSPTGTCSSATKARLAKSVITSSIGTPGCRGKTPQLEPGFARRAAHAMRQTSETTLHQLTTPDLVQGHHIATAAAAGDAVAQRLMDEEGEAIGAGLVNMLHLYSPAKIVLGGGVVINNPQLVERAKVVIAERPSPSTAMSPLKSPSWRPYRIVGRRRPL